MAAVAAARTGRGLVVATLGWWWADPVAALLMVPWLVHEGLEGLRGEERESDEGPPMRT